MHKPLLLLAALLLAASAAAMSGTLEKGDSELSLDLSYIDLDRDDGAEEEEARVEVAYGWLLTDEHEIGGSLFYYDRDGFEGVGGGPFYHYNFRAGDQLNPFVGARIAVLGGDLGDIYESAYGLVVGVKVFPFEHAGFSFGARYDWLQGDASSPDAEQASFFGSLRIKF